MLTDLHIHSYYSDGTMSPKEIAEDAKAKGIKIIAVTDHNVIDSYQELKEVCESLDIILIRGVEVDTKFEDIVVHVLAYSFNDDKELISTVNKAKNILLQTSIDLVDKMSNDYENISNEDYESYEYDRRKGGWKGLHYLYERGLSENLWAGTKFYGEYKCGHEQFEFPSLEEVCNAVHKAGGYAVLAHPCNYYKNLSKEEILEKLNIMKEIGIDGVECYYPDNDELMTNTCLEFCKENDLIITAGSDGHGAFEAAIKSAKNTIGGINKRSSQLSIEKLLK